MSSDLSIKPVGTPLAAPMLQPASPAADEAVATELPAPQSVAAADASPRLRHDTESAGDHLSHHVILDRDAALVVYQVVDNRTSLVVTQYPEQAVLRRRAYFRALNLAKAERTPHPITDRTA
jgi:hypothetical protein